MLIVEDQKKTIDKYSVFGNTIEITNRDAQLLPLYHYTALIQNLDDPDIFNTLLNIVKDKIYNATSQNFFRLKDIFDFIENAISETPLSEKKSIEKNDIVIALGLEITGLQKLGILFIDPKIDEIFFNPKFEEIIIEHSQFGRCKTEIFLSKEELDVFIERLCLENDLTISEQNPTIKCDLITKYFHLRTTLDIPPLAFDGISFNVRKLNNHHYSLFDLVKNNTLTLSAAIFIFLCYISQVNITIVGKPSVGKTTLQNSILELTPSTWRVISIEDAIESFSSRPDHLIRLKIKTLDDDPQKERKTEQVTKILHRAPDYLNLGEISTLDHINSWFIALSSGIPSIQTIHGNNIEALLTKVQDIFKIPLDLLKASQPHIFIEMESYWNKNKKIRRIKSISEITVRNNDDQIVRYIFKQNENLTLEEVSTKIDDSNSFKSIYQPFGLNKNNIKDLYIKAREFLSSEDQKSVDTFVLNHFSH